MNLAYILKNSEYNFNADLGYKNQVYNWYGLPINYIDFNDSILKYINEKQTYNTFYIGGKIDLKESVFSQAEIYYKHFWDAQKTSENRFWIKPSLNIDIEEKTQAKIDFIADYVSTQHNKDNFPSSDLKYSYFNLGLQPSLVYNKDDLSVKIGVELFYSIGKAPSISDKNTFHFYPQIQTSYRIVGDLMIAYAGIQGTLQQNSYADLVSENPFVSPTGTIPTNKKYDFFLGLKGKLADNIAYNLRGSYKNEATKQMYFSIYDDSNSNKKGYSFGNSLAVLYDEVSTLEIFGELKTEIAQRVSVLANASIRSYSTDIEDQAWYMPSINFSLRTNAHITEEFSLNANALYVGKRKARFISLGLSPDLDIIETLDGYMDISFGMNYKFNSRFGLFLNIYNLTDNSYQKWLNFPVQGIQIIGGANYKFDF